MLKTVDLEQIREIAHKIHALASAAEDNKREIAKKAEDLLAALEAPTLEEQEGSEADKQGAKPDGEGREKAARLIIDIYR